MISNRKLQHDFRKKDSDVPGIYDSNLFPNKHGEGKKSAVPDEQFENLEPDNDPVDQTPTRKAVKALQTMVQALKPDTTGELEGKFAIPLQSMIDRLNDIVAAEYSQWFRYFHYAAVLRGHYRDALAAELEKHAAQELEHASRVSLRVIGLGGYPSTEIKQPKALSDAEEILKELLAREQEGMKLYRSVHAQCGDNEGTKQIIESNIEIEQEHTDELWRYLRNPEMIKASSAGRETVSEKRYKTGYDRGFSRVVPGGVTGGPTPDLPDRGKDWHRGESDVGDESEYDKKPKNLLENKPSKVLAEAKKSLSTIPKVNHGVFVPPREAEFMREHGYTDEEINTGTRMTPRLRAMYNRTIGNSVSKSLSRLLDR